LDHFIGGGNGKQVLEVFPHVPILLGGIVLPGQIGVMVDHDS
jgi:hypothetical protein